MGKDYYKTLEVNKDATEQEIKSNYKRLAMKWHPDKNPNNREEATQKFNEISEAYNVLKDPTKRKTYDNFGEAGLDENCNDMGGFNGFGNFDPFSMFKNFFQKENDVPDIQISIKMTLEEIYAGTKKKVKFSRYSLCKPCKGKGAIGDAIECKQCNGKGISIARTPMGVMQTHCRACGGNGIDPKAKKCDGCKGKTCAEEEHSVIVTIPKGASHRRPIIIENEGNEIPENERNDKSERTNLVIIIEEIIHQKFKRGTVIPEIGKINDNNLLIEVKLTLEESLCGFEKVFTHLDNKLFKFSMTDVVKHGDIYVMKSMGMPYYDDSTKFGDLLIKISIEQKKLTNAQKIKIWDVLSDDPYKEIKKQSNVINFTEYKHSAADDERKENMKNKYRRRQQNDDDIDDDDNHMGAQSVQCAQQ
jgi:DnaJ-class molecular chaperone